MEKRISIGAHIILFIFAIFLLRLWHLQVIKGGEYKRVAEQNRLRIIGIPAPRGIIYDRNNNALVKNIPAFTVSITTYELPQDSRTLSEIAALLGLDPKEVKDRLNGSSISPFEPVKLKENLSWEEVVKIEARRIDFPALRIDVEPSRQYLHGRAASHVIGYLGRLNPQQAKNPDYRDVPRSAFIGQWGIEKIYDKDIRGIAGGKIIEVDATGREINSFGEKEAIKGNDIKLTIDIDLQKKAEEALRDKAGAVIAIDPNTGNILVLASNPSFDPNLFVRGISYEKWERFINDPKKPLLNRAMQSQYPPASTFKIITAIAALEEGVITENTEMLCKGGIPLGGRLFKCWKEGGHGVINFKRAIVESCDVYFYELGKKLGVDKIAEYALRFGLGNPLGLNLAEEKSGVVPTTAWKRTAKNEEWFLGETLITAIGQGYISATPLQMATLISAVVNGGKIYKPNLLNDGRAAEILKEVNVRAETLEAVKKALVGVVAEPGGTGYRAHSNLVSIGGKTGTAQVLGSKWGKHLPAKYRDHAWFVAFAPTEEPQIAIAVFVEHGGFGGAEAAQIAKAVIEEFHRKTQK